MREIKFKVWIPYASIMMRPKYIQEIQESIVSGITIGQMKQWIYLQYTGLKDKNKKDIYEGDIVYMNWLSEVNNEELINVIESKRDAGGFENVDQYYEELDSAKDLVVEELTTTIIFENGIFWGTRDGDQRILFYHKIKEWDVEVIGNIYETPHLLTTNK